MIVVETERSRDARVAGRLPVRLRLPVDAHVVQVPFYDFQVFYLKRLHIHAARYGHGSLKKLVKTVYPARIPDDFD